MVKVRRALLSVTDKTGLADFAKGLNAFRIELSSRRENVGFRCAAPKRDNRVVLEQHERVGNGAMEAPLPQALHHLQAIGVLDVVERYDIERWLRRW